MAVAPSALLAQAQFFEVDLFAADVPCGLLSGGALFTFHFASGKPLEFSPPPGRYTLVLRAFADDGGTRLLGQGCLSQEFGRGQNQCITLAVNAPDAQSSSDGSVDLVLPDGALDQAFSPAPDLAALPNYIFVTSQMYPPGSFNGLLSADKACNSLAQKTGLPGNFIAYLSTSQTSAVSRLGSARGWIRVDGAPVADRVADLASLSKKILFPPRLDETGKEAIGPAATGTQTDGLLASGKNCSDWTSSSAQDSVEIGSPTGGSSWAAAGYSQCSWPLRIYCLGIDRTVAIVPPKVPGRIAFISQGLLNPSMGQGSADALCVAEAATSKLPGTYKALLATTAASAASRFDYGNGTLPWVRPDGIPLVAKAADLMTGNLLAAPEVLADGTQATSGTLVSTGIPLANSLQPGGLSDTCQNWTSNSSNQTLVTGSSASSTSTAISAYHVPCSFSNRVYCLQE